MSSCGHERISLCGLRPLRDILTDLAGRRVTLVGLGRLGGGEGAARFLTDRGARLTVTDLRSRQQLAPSIDRLQDRNIDYRLEEHLPRDVREAELVVANPGVPREADILRHATAAGVPVTSPMNMFMALCAAPTVGITGSNGKSTTTSMTGTILRRTDRRTWVGGNIGGSLLPDVDDIEPGDVVVLELSSYQLEDLSELHISPGVAVVTNLSLNHLRRHGTMEAYERAKQYIGAHQDEDDTLILNATDSRLCAWGREAGPARRLYFRADAPLRDDTEGAFARDRDLIVCIDGREETICDASELPLSGIHNRENALAAATAARVSGAGPEEIRQGLMDFQPLEHRQEFVGRVDQVSVYNDSLSTTPRSAVAAVRSTDRPLVVIAGGYDKKLPLDGLAREIAREAEGLVTLGETGPELARQTREAAGEASDGLVIEQAETLEEAIDTGLEISPSGGSLLFTPACASFDMFENSEERGKKFKKLVRRRARSA